MSYWHKLWRVELIGIASLIIFSIGFGISMTIDALPIYDPNLTIFGWFGLHFVIALLIGMMPVIVYGAPLLTLHLVRPKFNLFLVSVAAILPGSIMLVTNDQLALYFLVGGPIVAGLMYILVRLWPNLR